jgi:hypothetical protein
MKAANSDNAIPRTNILMIMRTSVYSNCRLRKTIHFIARFLRDRELAQSCRYDLRGNVPLGIAEHLKSDHKFSNCR